MANKNEPLKAVRLGILLQPEDQKVLALLRKKLRVSHGNVPATTAIRMAVRYYEKDLKWGDVR